MPKKRKGGKEISKKRDFCCFFGFFVIFGARHSLSGVARARIIFFGHSHDIQENIFKFWCPYEQKLEPPNFDPSEISAVLKSTTQKNFGAISFIILSSGFNYGTSTKIINYRKKFFPPLWKWTERLADISVGWQKKHKKKLRIRKNELNEIKWWRGIKAEKVFLMISVNTDYHIKCKSIFQKKKIHELKHWMPAVFSHENAVFWEFLINSSSFPMVFFGDVDIPSRKKIWKQTRY